MSGEFISYAFQDLKRRRIVKLARQYEGVNMATLMGADEENFPFLILTGEGEYSVIFWNVYNGMMGVLDEDQVREFATANSTAEEISGIDAISC